MVRPMAIQAWNRPAAYSAPGRPIISQPDMSEAPADSAATVGESRLPPSM